MLLAVLNGTTTDELVIETSCNISRQTKKNITAIYVIMIPRDKPVDQEIESFTIVGERVLQDAEALAEKSKIKIKGQILQARSKGVAVVNYAKQENIDIVVTGINKKPLIGTSALDSDSEYILLNSTFKVITCSL